MNNPLLKHLKEGDLVLFAPPTTHALQTSPNIAYIAKISNLKFEPADEEHVSDWLECDQEILYCNIRLPKHVIKKGVYNMTGVNEKIMPELLEHTTKTHNLISAEKYALSDEEGEIQKQHALEFYKNSLIILDETRIAKYP